MHSNIKQLIERYIDTIWNKGQIQALTDFLHPHYTDHSLIAALSPDIEGTKKWIAATGASFEHTTIIDDMLTEGDKCFIKIRMILKHSGTWRDIPPTGLELTTTGYRLFHIQDGKIIEHWALIDGQTIENALRGASHGCKIV